MAMNQSEIRNPKSETNQKSEKEILKPARRLFGNSDFVLRICFGFRASDFVLPFYMVMLLLAGCGGSPQPTLAHGKPIEHWVQALRDPDARTRKRAADVLGNVGAADAKVVAALADGTRDRDRTVREATVLALLKIGPAAKDAAPALVAASKDSDAKVRAYASRALENIRAAQ